MVKLTFVLTLLAAMLLAACAPGSVLPPTATIPPEINPLTDTAAFVAGILGLSAGDVTLLSTEQAQWNDACLGAPRLGEACAEVITPGFKMTLQTPNGVYELHTDATGKAYRILPPGLTGTPTASAIEWERTGGIAGICQHMTIEFNGKVTLLDCKQNQTISEGSLPAADWEQLTQLLNTYNTFTWQVPRSSGADMFVDSYFFQGVGKDIPAGEKQVEINDLLAGIATNLSASTLPTASPTTTTSESGIEGQVLIGPACPGPVGTGTQCADKPYQATITVLNQQSQAIATIQTDAQGVFRIALEPGTYTLHPESATKPPYGADQEVTVPAGAYVQVTITYDSGIR